MASGADFVMLPYFQRVGQVRTFLELVRGRAKTVLLFETPEAVRAADEILRLEGIDECYIGLNDLHLGYHQKFLFQPLADGTVEMLCRRFQAAGKPYGFGGVARVGVGALPAERILAEHVRLGSSTVILSRSFCNARQVGDYGRMEEIFQRKFPSSAGPRRHTGRAAQKAWPRTGCWSSRLLHRSERVSNESDCHRAVNATEEELCALRSMGLEISLHPDERQAVEHPGQYEAVAL